MNEIADLRSTLEDAGCRPLADSAGLFGSMADQLFANQRVDPEHAFVWRGGGNRMSPTIKPGDLALIDLSDTKIRDSRMFAFIMGVDGGRFGPSLVIYRIAQQFNFCRLYSDQSAYVPIDLNVDGNNPGITVVGRVVATLRVSEMTPSP